MQGGIHHIFTPSILKSGTNFLVTFKLEKVLHTAKINKVSAFKLFKYSSQNLN